MNIPVDIIMPKIAPVVKQERTKKFGGTVKIVGEDLEQVSRYTVYGKHPRGKLLRFLLKCDCFHEWLGIHY